MLPDPAVPFPPAVPAVPATPVVPTVTVVGIGVDGWAGLCSASREAVLSAGVVVGFPRQLALLPQAVPARRVVWPTPLRPAVAAVIAEHEAQGLCVLASGDPMWHGIGRTLAQEIGADRLHVLTHPSSVQLACAQLGWAVERTQVVSLVAAPVQQLGLHCHEGARLLVLSRDATTPAAVADLLRQQGYGPSTMAVLSSLGVPRAGEPAPAPLHGTAQGWDAVVSDPLNVIAVQCRSDGSARHVGLVPGLPDDLFDHDGQITKREVRAITLSALAPAPGELLWDVGGGSGSVAIEWMRAHPTCRAVSIEKVQGRAERIQRNASRLGVPGLQVITGQAPEATQRLPAPDAVFVGGGLGVDGVVDACWARLRPGGRLVANAVTLESQAELIGWRARLGGDLTQVQVARAQTLGGFTTWRPALPLVQWCVVKTAAAQALQVNA